MENFSDLSRHPESTDTPTTEVELTLLPAQVDQMTPLQEPVDGVPADLLRAIKTVAAWRQYRRS